MHKMILAAVAVAVPLTLATMPSSAAIPPAHVWSELQGATPTTRAPAQINSTGFGAAVRNAEPGGYLAVLTQAQTNRLERACDVAMRGGSSAATIEFCHFLKDEIEVAEAEDSSN